MPNTESDWDEALRILAGDDADRAVLANIVRDEMERLQRAERGQLAARRSAPRASREREVDLTWLNRRPTFTVGVAAYDGTWLTQLFMDSMHEPVDVRFRHIGGVRYLAAPFDPSDQQNGDYVFRGVRGHIMLNTGLAEFYFTQGLMIDADAAASVVVPGAQGIEADADADTKPAGIVDVSATVPVK